jgi:hypothetical protein
VYLIERVLERHAGFGEGQFVQLVRVLKRWCKDNGKVIKGLTIEVLALSHLHDDERPQALARFFQGALEAIHEPIEDPAGLCGEVQPKLDRAKAEALLEQAADLSSRAITAAGRGEERQAQCLWHELLGKVFPEPVGGCGENSPGKRRRSAVVVPPPRPVQSVEEG